MKILQIIPAEGWFVRYHYDGEAIFGKILCWALVEDEDGDRRVTGVEEDGALCEHTDNFISYHWSGNTPEPFKLKKS